MSRKHTVALWIEYLAAVGIIICLVWLIVAANKNPQPAPVLPVPQLAGASIRYNPAAVNHHVGPDYLYPNPQLTPGKYATLTASDLTKTYSDNCPSGKTTCTYSADHRNVPASEHAQVYNEYNVPQTARNIQRGEVDHFYPLCAGGSNDITNLWYQPASSTWNGQNFGYHAKDKLETRVCQDIKSGKLTPSDAYQRITSDWVKFYLDLGLNKSATPVSAVE